MSSMILKIDIWRAAQLVLQQYKERAPDAAGERASELQLAGDAEGHTEWLRIVAAIVELQGKPGEGEALN